MFGLDLHEWLSGSWERARYALAEELDLVKSTMRNRWSVAFGADNQLRSLAISGDGATGTKYVTNTGVDHAPMWAELDLSTPDVDDPLDLPDVTGYPFTGTLTALNLPASGPTVSGTPANNQLAVWTSATAVEGEPDLTYDGTTLVLNPAIVQIYGANDATAQIQLYAHGSDEFEDVPRQTFARAKGTQASPTILTISSVLGDLSFIGYGTAYAAANAQIVVDTPETWVTTTSHPTRIRFSTTPSGSNTMAVRLTIHASGGVSVGSATDPGTGNLSTSSTDFLIRKTGTLANGAGAAGGTLTNAPAAGNPTKWLAVDDNGVTRHIPSW